MLLALTYADATEGHWGPPGRFAWKHNRSHKGPYVELLEEASKMGNNWPPTKAGLFRASTKRFLDVAEAYQNRMDRAGWR